MEEWIVDKEERLLSFVRGKINKKLSIKDLRWTIEHNRCHVNGLVERFASRPLKMGDKVVVFAEKRPWFKKEEKRVLYEDEHLMFYNKVASIDSLSLAEELNVELVHRLDRDTTGVILFAKNLETKKALEALFRRRRIQKQYFALVNQIPKKERGMIEAYIAPVLRWQGAVIWGPVSKDKGLWSKTKWCVEAKGKETALLRLFPLTGRTHQIRVHLKIIGHPILGDVEYGGREGRAPIFRPLLHAYRMALIHPYTNKELVVKAPLPEDFLFFQKNNLF